MKKERIWEVDALRGFMILCMIVVHLVIGSEDMIEWPQWLLLVFGRLGALFVILSGISATLGTRSFRRGVIVFACALVLELGSYIAVKIGALGEGMVIRFGVLHLLGVCMMVWPLMRSSTPWVLVLTGAVIIGIGYWFETLTVQQTFLYPLGLEYPGFCSGDYFPLFPQLGYFLIGGALGKWLYPEKKSLLPNVNSERAGWRFLRFCGRNSLIIYLVHFLAVGGILMLLPMLIK